jgi:oxygen-independent coproporphyrinogen-3 oxidase
MHNDCQALLAQAGYQQYEVSAYARPGARCRHNENYWRFGDYVGIGAGAHGKISLEVPERVLRTAKPALPREYQALARAASAPIGERRYVAPTDLPFEYMLNALRLNAGFRISDFRHRTGLSIDSIQASLARSHARGMLESAPGGWRATELGRRFLNDLQAAFLA